MYNNYQNNVSNYYIDAKGNLCERNNSNIKLHVYKIEEGKFNTLYLRSAIPQLAK